MYEKCGSTSETPLNRGKLSSKLCSRWRCQRKITTGGVFFTGKFTLISASLVLLDNLTESKTTWVEESEENSVTKTRALRLGIIWIRVAIPLVWTYLFLGKEHVFVAVIVLVVVSFAVSDKGRDKGRLGPCMETVGQEDKGQILSDHVVFCYPIEKIVAAKGNKNRRTLARPRCICT